MFFYRHRPGIVIAFPPESLSASARNRYRVRPGIVIGIERNMQVIPRNNPVNAYTMAIIVSDAGLTIEQFLKFI